MGEVKTVFEEHEFSLTPRAKIYKVKQEIKSGT